MNNTPDITLDVTTTITLPDILDQLRRQWGYQAIVEGIIDFVSYQDTEQFEDMLLAALTKFKADNAPPPPAKP